MRQLTPRPGRMLNPMNGTRLALLLGVALLYLPAALRAQDTGTTSFSLPLSVSHSDPNVISGTAEPGRPVRIGALAGANDGFGPEDRRYFQPGTGAFVDALVRHGPSEAGWPEGITRLREDIRAPIPSGQTKRWANLIVLTNQPGQVTLSWPDLSGVPESLVLALLDPDDANGDGIRAYSMRAISSISFDSAMEPGVTDSRSFTIQATSLGTGDSSVLILTTPIVTAIDPDSFTISFGSTMDATSVVEYGPSPSLGSTYVVPGAATRQHTATVSNLFPNTVYYFRVRASAPGMGDATSEILTVRTGPGLALFPPPTISGITTTSANLDVHATESSLITVEFGSDPQNLDRQLQSTEPGTQQSFRLTDLQANMHYTVRVTATAPNREPATALLSFTTAPQAAFTATPTVSGITGTSAIINFGVNSPATALIDYGPTTEYGLTREVTIPATTHSVILTDLTPGTLYHYRVTANSTAGGQVVSEDLQFATPVPVALTVPAISNVTAQSAQVSFMTDVEAIATIDYGTTEAFGQTLSPLVAATQHVLTLTNLLPNTQYFLRVRVNRPGRAEGASEVLTFTTEPGARVPGDLSDTADGRVDVSDVLRLVRFTLGLEEPSTELRMAADLDGNGTLDIADIVRLVRLSLGLPPAP